jgi:ABC-type multidrug transport system permease subunit
LGEEGKHMYITDVVWWGYTIFLVAVALFMIYFFLKVRQKGG